jgi:hypothetical protein
MKGVPKSAAHRAKLSAVLQRRYRCGGCGVEGNAGSIGNHQKASGHGGREAVR